MRGGAQAGAATEQNRAVGRLLAVATEFGDAAVDEMRTVLAFYEAMRASEKGAH